MTWDWVRVCPGAATHLHPASSRLVGQRWCPRTPLCRRRGRAGLEASSLQGVLWGQVPGPWLRLRSALMTLSPAVVFRYCRLRLLSAVTLFCLFQFEPQLHRPDRVSLHVALLLPAYLLWGHADYHQRYHPQWQESRGEDRGQGETALRLPGT